MERVLQQDQRIEPSRCGNIRNTSDSESGTHSISKWFANGSA